MHLRRADIDELAAALPLTVDLEPYRERLTPLAVAVLEGAPRRTIERQRDLVLSDVWDANLRRDVLEAIGRLRAGLERRLAILDEAALDIENAPRGSKLAPAIVDRVLEDLLANSDENIAALEALERELDALAAEDRPACAALAARGAGWVARIPANELRAAIVRIARSPNAERRDAEAMAQQLARALATDERQRAVREWALALGAGSAPNAPLLAASLQTLAAEPLDRPEHDLLWVQACVGLSLEVRPR